MATMHTTEGQVLKYEAPQAYSRENVTVASGHNLKCGAVVGRITASGKVGEFDPAASNGLQNAIGVLLADVDASAADQPGVIVARHAITVDKTGLVWKTGATEPQKDAAVAQLKALGILARKTA